MEIWEIITFGLAAIAVPLIVIFIRHLLTRDRDRLKGFNNASEEFRKVFNQALVDIRDDSFLFGTSANDDRIRTHRVAYLNFHYHLHGNVAINTIEYGINIVVITKTWGVWVF